MFTTPTEQHSTSNDDFYFLLKVMVGFSAAIVLAIFLIALLTQPSVIIVPAIRLATLDLAGSILPILAAALILSALLYLLPSNPQPRRHVHFNDDCNRIHPYSSSNWLDFDSWLSPTHHHSHHVIPGPQIKNTTYHHTASRRPADTTYHPTTNLFRPVPHQHQSSTTHHGHTSGMTTHHG